MISRLRLLPSLPLLTLCALAAPGPLVDFSIAGRSDSPAPDAIAWFPAESESDQREIGGVSMTLRAVDGALRSTWWKGGADDGARLTVDGVTAGPDGSLELEFAGLAPGRHSLVTYHNWSEPADADGLVPIDLVVGGGASSRRVQPTHRVASDWDAATGYLEFDAVDDGPVVIRVRPVRAGGSVVLCGFRLDAPDPRRQASHPYPSDGDGHVDADAGAVELAWRPAEGTAAHHVYVGRTEDEVASASPGSPVHRATTAGRDHRFETGGALDRMFWRIDSVDPSGRVTPGHVWSFRPRRLAFPDAEGYGRYAAGGRGGRVLHVTTLADSGPGSLRAAVEAAGPRTVVFDVGGLITLESRLTVRNPYLTVAGQTAPGRGVTVRGYSFGLLGTHDVIIRHVRVRPGNIAGVTLDGMGMASSDHSIIDHASISWTIDEAFSSRGARNITLQRTLISEALNVAGHKKYRPGTQHGYAASISGLIGSFHHNLLAHNSGRNWSLAGGLDGRTRHTGWLDIRNNVVYNWQNRTTDGGAAKVNYVANYYRPGPATKVFHLLKPERNNIAGFGPQDYYVEGNVMEGHVGAGDPLGGVLEPEPHRNFIKPEPFFEPFVDTQSARAAYKRVLSDVGCNQPVLDDHDQRVIRETLERSFTHRGSRTGLPGLPDSQDDVGGWEDYPEVRRPEHWDADRDGLPGWWERIHGLDPKSPAGDLHDAGARVGHGGYTHLEAYLNWMGRPHRVLEPGETIEIDLGDYTRGFTDGPVHRLDAAAPGEARLLPDAHTVRYTAPAGEGLAELRFTVRDAEGDAMTRTLGLAIVR